MKGLAIFSVLLWASTAAALVNRDEDGLPLFNMDRELTIDEMQELKELVAKELQLREEKLNSVSYTCLINDFMDELLANVQTLILKNNLDPIYITDEMTIDIGIGKTTLSEGQLNDTHTIMRYENASLSYDTDTKQLVADMVLRFEDLKFIFKYHTKVGLISMTGHLHGDVEHIHIHVKMGFDFKSALMFVDSIDFKHTGSISLKVSGNALIDWITNAMSTVLTGILHNLILDIIKNMIASPIDTVVDLINQMLHPSLLG
ncbi:uncharacterized protein LOC126745390 [Anthonomus grandis grandis]|uniref:uncharacterized protein LOC126745390 n=1 Tax=Anthonomus grandis grandis TaxID=2921223 RepID=UPI00216597EC|nr:uncharacterized protein LOC126745390 [Anthonomus grandis grandis]